jgi:adenylate cyclase
MGSWRNSEVQSTPRDVRSTCSEAWASAIELEKDRRIIFRIGLSCGRIIADPDDIYGHDVNVSARLQTVAPPGGIAMSGEVAALVRQTLPISLEDMGEQHFHNMNCAVRVFQYRAVTMVN